MEEGVQPTTEEHAEAKAPSCGACRLTLTDAEREAVEAAIGVLGCDDGTLADCSDIVAPLRGLLERTGAANSGDDRRSGGGEHARSAAANEGGGDYERRE